MQDRMVDAIERLHRRTEFHERLYKLACVCLRKGLRLIIENPCTGSYLKSQNFPNPSLVDKDRSKRGDTFKKPTGYWFFNCVPSYGYTEDVNTDIKTILGSKPSGKAGHCSADRSMISERYIKNFINDNILGTTEPRPEMWESK